MTIKIHKNFMYLTISPNYQNEATITYKNILDDVRKIFHICSQSTLLTNALSHIHTPIYNDICVDLWLQVTFLPHIHPSILAHLALLSLGALHPPPISLARPSTSPVGLDTIHIRSQPVLQVLRLKLMSL